MFLTNKIIATVLLLVWIGNVQGNSMVQEAEKNHEHNLRRAADRFNLDHPKYVPTATKTIQDEDENCLYVQFVEIDVQFDGGKEETIYSCNLVTDDNMDGMSFRVDLPDHFIEKNYKAIHTGKVWCIPDGKAQIEPTKTVTVPDITTVHIVNDVERRGLSVEQHQRRLDRSVGIKNGLIVRLSSDNPDDNSVSVSTNILAGKTFGVGPNRESVSMTSQYRDCSGGAFTVEARDFHDSVENGAVDVVIPDVTITGSQPFDLQNAAIQATRNKIGSSNYDRYDHVLFVFPRGTLFGNNPNWLAYAPLPGKESWYNNEWGISLSATTHEIGHNIGFHHSGQGSDQYGDQSGMMGYSRPESTVPQQCFNGAKTFESGWLPNSQSREVTQSQLPVKVRLASIPDVGKSEASNMAIAIKAGTSYLAYNRAKDFNRQTQEFQNDVTVVESAPPPAISNNRNSRLDAIGDTFSGADNFSFVLCELGVSNGVDWAVVGIYRSGTSFSCNDDNNNDPPPDDGDNDNNNDDGGCVRTVITIQLDNYGAETTYQIRNPNGRRIAREGPYENFNPELIQDEYCLERGCYRFEIIDSERDGICCDWGEGYYTVEYDGREVVSGGRFRRRDRNDFGDC